MLDVVEDRLARGEGSAGLTRYLARAGFSHLVLRNDLDVTEAASTRSALVRQALLGSPGSPVWPRSATTTRRSTCPRAPSSTRVWASRRRPSRSTRSPTRPPGPGRHLCRRRSPSTAVRRRCSHWRSAVWSPDRPVLLAGESSVETGSTMVTDALLRRERDFGRVTGATSGALTADAPLTSRPGRPGTTPCPGWRRRRASSTTSARPPPRRARLPDNLLGGGRPETQPWAAVDSDFLTGWRPASDPGRSRPDWWRLTTDEPFAASLVTVALGADLGGKRPAELRLTTDAGTEVVRVRNTGRPQTFRLPRGSSSTLTIGQTTTGAGRPVAGAGRGCPSPGCRWTGPWSPRPRRPRRTSTPSTRCRAAPAA